MFSQLYTVISLERIKFNFIQKTNNLIVWLHRSLWDTYDLLPLHNDVYFTITVNFNWKFKDFKFIYVELKYNSCHNSIFNIKNYVHATSLIIVFYIYFGDVGWFMNIFKNENISFSIILKNVKNYYHVYFKCVC